MNLVRGKMESSSSTYTMPLHLEEKVSDLENKLSHTNQTLRTKEHVLHLQQEQIKKMEGRYKKCLDDFANVNCEHKKALHDLENLRIILKSYENRHSTQTNFECQVDLMAATEHRKEDQLMKINEILENQNRKSDHIIHLLQNHVSSDRVDCIQDYIEDLQKISQTLLITSEHRSNQVLSSRSMMFPIMEEGECTFSAKYKLMEYANYEDSMSLVMENSSQTRHEMRDASFNLPEMEMSSSTTQATITCSSKEVTTETPRMESKFVNCIEATSTSEQTSIFDDLFSIKSKLDDLEVKTSVTEKMFSNHKEVYNVFNEVLMYFDGKKSELDELKEKVTVLNAVIDRNSLLTIDQVKRLCKDVTVKTGEEYTTMMLEVHNLREEKDMLKVEIQNLKTNHSEIPRVVVELFNQEVQTYEATANNLRSEDYRQKIAALSKELEHAYETITYMRNKLDYHEVHSNALDELKSLCLTLNSETAELHNYHLFHLREKYENQIGMLERQLAEVKESPEMNTSSTQISGWAPMKEQVDMLRTENEELINQVQTLKTDVEKQICNQSAMDELKMMCLKLGQNMNESTSIKKENIMLKQQLEEAIEHGHGELEELQKNYYDAIKTAREEIHNLRAENKELSEGIDELKMVVDLNGQLAHFLPDQGHQKVSDSDTCESGTDSEHHVVRVVTLINQSTSDHAQIQTPTGNNDLDELKSICKDLSSRLKYKKMPCLDGRFELLASLENDLRILMKEFLDFKWTSQSETQRMILKHSELSSQNEDLISCLNQYKTVNESLLKSHYELEQAKAAAQVQHRDLLEDYLKLQKKLQPIGVDCGTNTLLGGRDLSDANALRCENVEVHKQNVKLKQEVENLLVQINDEHKFCLMKLQESVDGKTCEQCVTTLNTLQTLNVDFKRVSNENTTLKRKLREMDSLLGDMGKKHVEHTKMVVDYNRVKEDLNNLHIVRHKLQLQNDDLVKDMQNCRAELNIAQAEREGLAHQVEVCKHLVEELAEYKDKLKDKEADIEKYREEVGFLQNAIAKVGNIHEKCSKLEEEVGNLRVDLEEKNAMIKCNESLMLEYKQIEDQLKSMTTVKNTIEQDFESYVRSNTLWQQTLNQRNESLIDEVAALNEENQRLNGHLKELYETQNVSRDDFVRVADECKLYKCQLEDMAKRIDRHMQEHLDYKHEVAAVKETLQDEITSLKQMLEMQYINMDASDVLHGSKFGEEHMEELKTFINAKEMEIDFLMAQKLKAMSMMGKLYVPVPERLVVNEGGSSSRSGRTSTREVMNKNKEQLKLQVNFRKAQTVRPILQLQPLEPSQPRSASVPRTRLRPNKDSPKRSEPSSSRIPQYPQPRKPSVGTSPSPSRRKGKPYTEESNT